jgi:hypothetical protein
MPDLLLHNSEWELVQMNVVDYVRMSQTMNGEFMEPPPARVMAIHPLETRLSDITQEDLP